MNSTRDELAAAHEEIARLEHEVKQLENAPRQIPKPRGERRIKSIEGPVIAMVVVMFIVFFAAAAWLVLKLSAPFE